MKTIDISTDNVNTIYKKYNKKLDVVKSLVAKIELLKITVKKHFEQMEQDSAYLKRLELIRPKYFKTLEKYNKQLNNVKATIDRTIIEGDDKSSMIKIIGESNEHTQNFTGRLSKAFLEHYEKYKNILSKDTVIYNENIKELEKETSLYNEEEKSSLKYYSEYKSALDMLNKLKFTYAESESEAKDFDNVVKIIKTIFKNPNKIKSFFDGPLDNKCATTMLKTHIKNELL